MRYNYDFLKIISNLEENTRVNIYVPGLGNDLLNMTPKAQTIKQWNDGLSECDEARNKKKSILKRKERKSCLYFQTT